MSTNVKRATRKGLLPDYHSILAIIFNIIHVFFSKTFFVFPPTWRPNTHSSCVTSRESGLYIPGIDFTQIFRQLGHTCFKPDAFFERHSTLRNVLAIDCSTKKWEYFFAFLTRYDYCWTNRFFHFVKDPRPKENLWRKLKTGQNLATIYRAVYTTSVLGTARLNLGTRTYEFWRGTLNFCRVNGYKTGPRAHKF